MLARAFVIIAEQQRALFEQQHQMLTVLQHLVETPRIVNFISVELDESVSVEGALVVDKSATDASTHIGGNVGALAQSGAMQFVGPITQNVTQLQSNPETKAAAEAIKKLADAIATSAEVPSEYERETYLMDLRMLSEQAALPREKRQPVTPIIDRIAGFCSGAGGLAAIWSVAGPPLMALFS